MDFMTIIGLISVLATVIYVLAASNILHILFNPLALIVVYGGTFSATLIAYPWDVLKEIAPSMRVLLFPSKNTARDRQDLIDLLTSLSEKAKREGIDSLGDEIPKLESKFLVHGIQMLVDGLDQDLIRENLEREIYYTRQNHQKVSGTFRTMATVAPIFGLLGTLLGIVEMLRNLSNPELMGQAMANAVTATFYGIFSANIFIPIATKLSDHSERDIITQEMIVEGVISIYRADVPIMARKKLNAFVMAHVRGKAGEKKN